MVGRIAGYVFKKPVGRNKSVGLLLRRKFHFCDNKRCDCLLYTSFGEHSALHIPNDYYTYGGITRPAAVEYIPDTYIKNIRFTPQLTCGRWSAETEVFVCNVSGREMEISVEVKLAGCCMEETVTVGGGCEEHLVFAMEFDEVQAWSNACLLYTSRCV